MTYIVSSGALNSTHSLTRFFAVDINMQSERQETDEDSCVVQISKEHLGCNA